MRARHYKWVWLFCALLLAFQSLLPVSAMAFVSVHCVGASATAPACAEAVLPVVDTMGARTYLAPMSCCLHSSRTSDPITLSAPTCLVTVNPLNTERASAILSVRQWMLNASPALAPPANSHTLFPVIRIVALVFKPVSHLPHSRFVLSHGLRAPPVV